MLSRCQKCEGSRDQRRRAARLLSVGQQPSYTEIVTTTTGVCSAALISDVPCSRRFCHRQEWVPFECSFYLHQRKYKFPSMSFITRRASHHIPQLSRIYGFWQFGCGSVAKNSKVIVKQSLINSNLFLTRTRINTTSVSWNVLLITASVSDVCKVFSQQVYECGICLIESGSRLIQPYYQRCVCIRILSFQRRETILYFCRYIQIWLSKSRCE